MNRAVRGVCPACGAEKLAVTPRGVIVCCGPDCDRQTAVTELLADRETEHVARIDRGDFTLRHPLRERLDDALFTCELHDEIATSAIAPRLTPGRYRVTTEDHVLAFTPLDRTEPNPS